MKVNIPIYFGSIEIIVSDNFREAIEPYSIDCGKWNINDHQAFTYRVENGKYLMFIRPENPPSVIAHESLHITNHIMNDVGMRADLDNDEPQCYLLGWIVEQAHKALVYYVQ